MDRFCKELRSAGARKQSWRVSIFGHTPQQPAMEGPAATVIDLAKAYFADARLPVECKEFRRPLGVVVRMDAREGRIWVNGTPGTATAGWPHPRCRLTAFCRSGLSPTPVVLALAAQKQQCRGTSRADSPQRRRSALHRSTSRS